MIGYRKQADYPGKQATEAGQGQAGSITSRKAGKQRSKVLHYAEDDVALNQSKIGA